MKEAKLMVSHKDDSDEEAHRQGKWDLETIMAAEEIKADPKKMKHVMKHAKSKMASIKSIQDLKDAYEAKYGEGRLHESAESKAKERKEKKLKNEEEYKK